MQRKPLRGLVLCALSVSSKTDATGTTSYTYDPLERLKAAGSNTYSLDNGGNLLSGEGHTFAVNSTDQFASADSSSLTFDGAGNLSGSSSPATSFSYNPTNQLTSSSQSGTRVFQAGYDTADQTQPAAITERVGSTTTTHAFAHTELAFQDLSSAARQLSRTVASTSPATRTPVRSGKDSTRSTGMS
ncbi:hypothetical protein [Kutzneria sp. NPDC051319]|uniref:hypothetical protein n=1 Tax=Kutzneria sp. NPDC051319 TaxID=3155047 RepID=UPI0034297C50